MVINTTTRDPPNIVTFYETGLEDFEPHVRANSFLLSPRASLKHSYMFARFYWKKKDKQRYLMTMCAIIMAYKTKCKVSFSLYDRLVSTTTHEELVTTLRQMVGTLKTQNTYVTRFFNTVSREMPVSVWSSGDHDHALGLLVSFIWASATAAGVLSKYTDDLSQDNHKTITRCYSAWVVTLESIITLLTVKR